MQLQFRILGCGSSGGVPRINGDWGACDPKNDKNRRTRCSLLIRRKGTQGETSVLIDTSPDMRAQLLDAGINSLDGILYTHDHADQTHGIDDIRALVYAQKRRINVWMDAATSQTLTARFAYCFEQHKNSIYPSVLTANLITAQNTPINIEGEGGAIQFHPFLVHHGRIDALGFRIGDTAYTPDISDLPVESYTAVSELSCWVIDALRYEPHPTHLHLEKTLALIDQFKPKRAILTNLHIDMDYDTLAASLPTHIIPAYDSLEFTV